VGLLRYFDRWLGYSIRRQLLDEDLESLRLRMEGRVVEIGNGHSRRRGKFEPPISEAECWVFIDVKETVQPDIRASIESIPLKDAEFDTVICLEVMEYVTDVNAALKEVHRILKPGGRLILSVPFMHRADTEHDFWRFSSHALKHLLSRDGFRIEDIRSQGAALAVAVNILKYAVYSIKSDLMRQIVALLTVLPLRIIFWLDNWSRKRISILNTFSTGYLILATKIQSR
jgi:SAM-dependent methyltransferase